MDGNIDSAKYQQILASQYIPNACKVAFHAIPDDFFNKLYDSLPNRMATVLQVKGTQTRYELFNF